MESPILDLEQEQLIKRSRHLKLIAFGTVVLSTLTVSFCILLFPAMIIYMQSLQSELAYDTHYCKSRSSNIWNELQQATGISKSKSDRHAEGEDFASVPEPLRTSTTVLKRVPRQEPGQLIIEPMLSRMICCTCTRGAAGIPGAGGAPGREGGDGRNGDPGRAGMPAPEAVPPPSRIMDCPCEAERGDPGLPGRNGPPGQNGQPGMDGSLGSPGKQGERGRGGLPGPPGMPGKMGGRGPNGSQGQVMGKRGDEGERGKEGRPGPTGAAGDLGPDGRPGTPGEPGFPGPPGKDGGPGGPGKMGPDGPPGPLGSCDHCPEARVAPGYFRAVQQLEQGLEADLDTSPPSRFQPITQPFHGQFDIEEFDRDIFARLEPTNAQRPFDSRFYK